MFRGEFLPNLGSRDVFIHLMTCRRYSVPTSCPTLSTPWTAARQTSLSITNSRSLPKLTSIESVMPSTHLTLCRSFLLLPSISD